jgi:5-methyltetrahydrofolate--homocysteine methyltransferase
MRTSLESLLAARPTPSADGATGTNLFNMGLTSGDSPELWNETHRDTIRALHQSFVDAGADIILTNSFGANRRRLMLHGLEDRTRELNRLAAENARAVADAAGRPVVMAARWGRPATSSPPSVRSPRRKRSRSSSSRSKGSRRVAST